jgi:hypothetical protein
MFIAPSILLASSLSSSSSSVIVSSTTLSVVTRSHYRHSSGHSSFISCLCVQALSYLGHMQQLQRTSWLHCDRVCTIRLTSLVSYASQMMYNKMHYHIVLCVIGEYLLEQECPWSYTAQETARFFRNYELEKWLIAKGCPRRKH